MNSRRASVRRIGPREPIKLEAGELLDVAEAARILGVSDETVYNLLRDGSIQSVRIRKRWKVSRTALEAFLTRAQRGVA